MNVAFFGGSFNPPHLGHVMVVSVALSVERVDLIYVVPCCEHVFAKELAAFEHRLKMARMAFAPFGGLVRVSDVEKGLPRPNRTVETLEHLKERNPDWTWRLLVGADIEHEKVRWHRFDRVEELARPLVVGRATFGDGEVGVTIPNVSSTEIRRLVAEGKDTRGLVPLAVAEYVERHGLYRPC